MRNLLWADLDHQTGVAMLKYHQMGSLFETHCLGASVLDGPRAASVGHFQEGGREMLDEEIKSFVETHRLSLLQLIGGMITASGYKKFLLESARGIQEKPIFVLFGDKSVEVLYQKLLAAAEQDYGDTVAELLKKG